MAIPEQLLFDLHQHSTIDQLKETNAQFNHWLCNAFQEYPTTELVKDRSEFVDTLLKKLWQIFELDNEPTLCLAAVGGYGRAELHPRSDIDLLILTSAEPSLGAEEKIGKLIATLWDFKFDVGQSVRTVKETIYQGKKDVTVATNLMEMRHICGPKNEYTQLKDAISKDDFWSSRGFFIAKKKEQNTRHEQFHGTAYSLEPNLKATPGGLRDLQTIGWVAKKHFNVNTFAQLIEHGYLTQEEYQELLECQDNLWNIRFALHVAAGRAENRLLFDYQPEVAKVLGFGDDGKISVERMMKRLFRIMMRAAELNKMLLQHFEMEILKSKKNKTQKIIDENFMIYGDLIQVTNDSAFLKRGNILWMFLHIADNPSIKGIHSDTLRLMRQVRRRLIGDLQDYAECRFLFLKLFRHPNGMGTAFTLMHQHGILSAYFSLWKNIVGQMQFDLFHAYTVDEHTHRLVKYLYRYFLPEFKSEFPICHEIARKLNKPELLFLAGIFHDIAKGRGGDHSDLGAIDAMEFCRSHKMREADSELIAWLVQNHLLMSTTAQRKDIQDPEVIQGFADQVKDQRHLDYLYLLTVADIRATNDNLWNDWKNSLFKQLYQYTTTAFMHGEKRTMDIRLKAKENRQDAKALILERGFDESDIDAVWTNLKADYFAKNPANKISWETREIIKHTDKETPLVRVSKMPIQGGTLVFVYTKDQPDLFAAVVSALRSKRVSIFDAQIMRTKDGYALDSFVILEPNGKAVTSQSRINSIKSIIQRALKNRNTVKNIKHRLSRKLKQFDVPPKIKFLRTSAKNRTLVEIVSLDMPGLLAEIGEVFLACNLQLHSAKITTIGERAEDIFMLSDENDKALTKEKKQHLKETVLTHLSKLSEIT
ncbi:[protein-PII] uridylyltransferase [Flocculibacter collagenilyticus]|uniref:[protein-PII] uridylyltransferase n=1 Tax=Flocculibacter collagenilyticus TaxID=2744479 RepID=UPI0018F3537F|nr:[protein-PII] uridylyltransferase [Flocculibacter collagenilyticus]